MLEVRLDLHLTRRHDRELTARSFCAVAWFNYDKEQEFRLWIEGDDKVNGAMKDWLQTSSIKASGATAGNA